MVTGGVQLSEETLILCLLGTVALLVGGVALCLRAWQGKWAPRKVFLCLFVPLALLMLLAMPIGRVPDEDSHLQRIWLLS